MENRFLPDLPENERVQILQEQSAHVREGGYDSPLSSDEIDNKKAEFYKNQIEIMDLEEAKKELVKEKTEEIKDLKMVQLKLHQEIQSKSTKSDGILYDMPNYESGFMETFDKGGHLIETRRLTPAEKNATKNIFFNPKTGTNG